MEMFGKEHKCAGPLDGGELSLAFGCNVLGGWESYVRETSGADYEFIIFKDWYLGLVVDNIHAFIMKIFPPFLDINLPIIVKYFELSITNKNTGFTMRTTMCDWRFRWLSGLK